MRNVNCVNHCQYHMDSYDIDDDVRILKNHDTKDNGINA